MSSAAGTPRQFQPVIAQYPGDKSVTGGGVAIFHLATSRVVICSAIEGGIKYYFLPKGRRDAGEESGPGAEREGYEEVRSTRLLLAGQSLTFLNRAVTATVFSLYPSSIANRKHILVYTPRR